MTRDTHDECSNSYQNVHKGADKCKWPRGYLRLRRKGLADGRTGFRGRQVVRVAERTEEEDMWAIYYLLGA